MKISGCYLPSRNDAFPGFLVGLTLANIGVGITYPSGTQSRNEATRKYPKAVQGSLEGK